MDVFPSKKEPDPNLVHLFRSRELEDAATQKIRYKLQVTESFVSRLGLETELKAHTGCVNCLEWNETGEILASASDDLHIVLWDPFKYKKKLVLHTGHRGNVFSVKFMPKSNDKVLVSGAGDFKIRVHDIALKDTVLACDCHTNRVKRIATGPGMPYLFWSAAEDGFVLQFDMRVPHICKSNDRKNVLVNLTSHVKYPTGTEAKCIAVNPAKPELVAVGANDAYIRMFDRRMIKLSQKPAMSPRPSSDWLSESGSSHSSDVSTDANLPAGCVQYFIAGHLHSQLRENGRNLATTYLTFSADGNELLVNMGGEQVYLFDVNDGKNSKTLIAPLRHSDSDSENDVDQKPKRFCLGEHEFDSDIDYTALNVSDLPKQVEELKMQANEGFNQKKYNFAINLYNKALSMCPMAAVLFANRAAAYIKRAWDGDMYAALRDCQVSLLLEPNNAKVHLRMARCLKELNRSPEALQVIESFHDKFPDYSSFPTYKNLKKDIKKACSSANSKIDPAVLMSEQEKEWRRNTIDYKLRFCGHCNTTTDIKEANFFGNDGQYIVAGSDDGSFFIWDRATANIQRILRGDDRIVNCLQPHPSTCLLATSGIDPVIRLWSPLSEDGTKNEREILNLDDAASANQVRMNSDPFELMLMNMGYRLPHQSLTFDDDSDEQQPPVLPLNCRPS